MRAFQSVDHRRGQLNELDHLQLVPRQSLDMLILIHAPTVSKMKHLCPAATRRRKSWIVPSYLSDGPLPEAEVQQLLHQAMVPRVRDFPGMLSGQFTHLRLGW